MTAFPFWSITVALSVKRLPSAARVGVTPKVVVVDSGAVPVPVRLRVCGLPVASSVNTRLPELVPTKVGVKVSATVQESDTASGVAVEQVVPEAAIAKGPVVVMALKVTLAVPVLVSVTVCGGLAMPTGSVGNVGAADKLKVMTGASPVPVRLRVWGLPVALSVNMRLPEFVPTAVGVKVSATVHEPEAATSVDVEQVVPEAAIANGPLTVMAVKVRLLLPVFVTVTVCAGLVFPTVSEGKVGGADNVTVV